MIAPVIGGLEIELTGNIVSAPYIDMTMSVMQHFGIQVQWNGSEIIVPTGDYLSSALDIDADWSAASFWMALQALLPASHITLRGLQPDSWQGDARMLTFMQQMGLDAHWQGDGRLDLDMSRTACCCCSTFADLNGTPDLAPTLIAALCLLGRPFRLTGLRTLRHKESDRREALRTELMKIGYVIQIDYTDFDVYYATSSYSTRAKYIVYAGEGTNGEVLWQLDANGRKGDALDDRGAEGLRDCRADGHHPLSHEGCR